MESSSLDLSIRSVLVVLKEHQTQVILGSRKVTYTAPSERPEGQWVRFQSRDVGCHDFHLHVDSCLYRRYSHRRLGCTDHASRLT